jgi:transcriptional regulator with XRE-family HTH domain
MSEVIENIKNIRRSKGISQESIAYDLGIDYSTYGKIERGQISLTVDRLEKISKILQVSTEEIYKWDRKDSIKDSENDKLRLEYYKYLSEIEHLRVELELAKQQISDKEKIIKLLEESRMVK